MAGVTADGGASRLPQLPGTGGGGASTIATPAPSEARLQALLSSLEDLVFELDECGRYLSVWTLDDTLLIRPVTELLGMVVRDALGEEMGERITGAIGAALQSGHTEFVDYHLKVPAGFRYFQARISPIAGTEQPRRVCLLARNVTAQRLAEQARDDAEERLRHQALYDGLTDLPNRSQFHASVEKALVQARRNREEVAVFMLDLDRFKEINDTLGHAAGDAVLVEVARRLRRITRDEDAIARLGGDEFAVLLPNSSEADAELVAARVARCLEESIVVDNLPLNIEMSAGLAVYPHDGQDADVLLRRADAAMYFAKSANLPSARYDACRDRRMPSRLALAGELRRALDRRELVLHYQPELELATSEVRAAEALLRWRHPERGLIAPAEFVPLVQESGLIKPLTHYVLDQALAETRRFMLSGHRLRIAVNLAMRNLIDVDLPDDVADLLDRHEVPPELLDLEITESSVVADPRRTRAVLERLSDMGIRLSIDDFGTGYSSLTYLTRLPVDAIKIDRSFVTHMTNSPEDEVIVRSTIDLADNLGKDVVAEGVETEETLARLRALGCDLAQGFFISRPVPPEALESWLAARDGSPGAGRLLHPASAAASAPSS